MGKALEQVRGYLHENKIPSPKAKMAKTGALQVIPLPTSVAVSVPQQQAQNVPTSATAPSSSLTLAAQHIIEADHLTLLSSSSQTPFSDFNGQMTMPNANPMHVMDIPPKPKRQLDAAAHVC